MTDPAPQETEMNSHDLTTKLVPNDLYLEIQQFYALQLKILDRGDGAQWARTFTPDGVFQAADMPDPWSAATS